MRTFIALIAYFVTPCILPQTAGLLRLSGLLVLLVCAFALLWTQRKKASLASLFSQGSTTAVAVPLLGMGWFFSDDRSFFMVYPSVIAGALVWLMVRESPLPAWLGMGCIAASGWALLILHQVDPALIPADFFYREWNTILSSVQHSAVNPLLGVPNPHALIPLQWLTYLSTFLMVLSAYWQPDVQRRFVFSMLMGCVLVVYGGFLIYVLGESAFRLMTVCLVIYLVVYLIPCGAVSKQNGWSWVLLLAFFGAGAFGWLDVLVIQISQLVLLLPVHLPPPILLPTESITPAVWNPVDWISAAILTITVVNAAFHWKELDFNNVNLALALSLFAGTAMILPFSALSWLAHPAFWLFTASLGFTPAQADQDAHPTDPKRTAIHPGQRATLSPTVIQYGTVVLILVAGVWAIYAANTERIAEHHILRLHQNHRSPDLLTLADQARKQSHYHPGIRAIYISLYVQDAVDRSAYPSEERLIELEVTNQVCSQNGIIPYLSVKRTSDFYFLLGNTPRTTASIADILGLHPVDITLHAMLAERLFDFAKFQEALQHYEICINKAPSTLHFHKKIAQVYKTLGNTEAYEQSIAIVQTLHPSERIP